MSDDDDDNDDVIDSYIAHEKIDSVAYSDYPSHMQMSSTDGSPTGPIYSNGQPLPDPYQDKDFNELNQRQEEMKQELGSFAFEEAKAFRAPLRSSDLIKMEKDSKKIYDDVHKGMDKATF